MNRLIPFTVFLLMLSGYTSSAQEFTFGPKVGFNSSHLTTNQDSLKDEFRQGFEAGVFFRFYGDYLYAQPEILYVTKGGIFNTEDEDFKEEIDVQSIDVPIIFGLKLGPEEFNFRLFGGPIASFVVQKKVTMTGPGMTSVASGRNIKDSMLGATVGLGIDLLSFSLDVRYEYGWDNVYKQNDGDPNLNWKHEMFNVSLGFKIL